MIPGDPCYEWPGYRARNGYGRFEAVRDHKRVTFSATNVVWEAAHGPVPPEMDVCHRCDNPSCIKLSHLFLGTRQDNVKDMLRKGRSGGAKLSYADAETIRMLYSARAATQRELADGFSVSPSNISMVVRRKTWV